MKSRELELPKGIHDYNFEESSQIINLVNVLRELSHEGGYEEVVLSSLYYEETSDLMQTSIGKRYDLQDKKGRKLTLAVDSSLSIMRGLGAKLFNKGHISTFQRVFRYRNAPYRSWYQYCYGIYGVGEKQYADSSILLLINKIIERLNIINSEVFLNECYVFFSFFEKYFSQLNDFKDFLFNFKYEIDKDEQNKVLYAFSKEDQELFFFLINNKLTIRELDALVERKTLNKSPKICDFLGCLRLCSAKIPNFEDRFFVNFGKYKSLDVYDGLTYQVYDADQILIMEGGRYDEFSSLVTDSFVKQAASLCVGVDLFARKYKILEKESLQKVFYYILEVGALTEIGFMVDKINKNLPFKSKTSIDFSSKNLMVAKNRAIAENADWFVVIGDRELCKNEIQLNGVNKNRGESLKVIV